MTACLTLAAFGAVDWLVLAVYLAVIVAIGAWSARGQSDDESYFLANRSMPWWAVSLSLLATALSAVTFIGAPQEAFVGNLSYLILNLGGIIAVFIVALLFIPAFYRAGTLTIYGLLEDRFGPTARVAMGIAFLIGRLLASGARLFVAAVAVSLLMYGTGQQTNGQLITAIIMFGLIGTLYTTLGGIKAVIWTDVLQIIVVIGVAVISVLLLVDQIPLSLGQMVEHLRVPVVIPATDTTAEQVIHKLQVLDLSPAMSKPYTLWTGLFAVVFLNVAAYGVDQDLAQRMLTCKTAWRSGLSLIAAIFLSVFVVLLFMIIGLLLFLLNDPQVMGVAGAAGFDSSERVFPQFLIEYLPTGLAGLAMAGLFAAGMSSLDSAINAMASSFIADVRRPLRRRFGKQEQEIKQGVAEARLTVMGMGAALTTFAILAAWMYDSSKDTLLGFALGVMSFAYAGMLGVFLTALLTRRGNTVSVIAALVAGALTVLLLQPYMLPKWLATPIAWPWWMPIATTVSFLVCVSGRCPRNAPRNTPRNAVEKSCA